VIVAAKDKAAVDRGWLDLAGLKNLNGVESVSFCVFLYANAWGCLFPDVCA
jgi:hypothetical protein